MQVHDQELRMTVNHQRLPSGLFAKGNRRTLDAQMSSVTDAGAFSGLIPCMSGWPSCASRDSYKLCICRTFCRWGALQSSGGPWAGACNVFEPHTLGIVDTIGGILGDRAEPSYLIGIVDETGSLLIDRSKEVKLQHQDEVVTAWIIKQLYSGSESSCCSLFTSRNLIDTSQFECLVERAAT